MNNHLNSFKLLFFICIVNVYASSDWNCSKEDAIQSFKKKNLLNQYPKFLNNPYLNQTSESIVRIKKTLDDKEMVCAIKYLDNTNRTSYTIKNFPNKQAALNENHIVTHQGKFLIFKFFVIELF